MINFITKVIASIMAILAMIFPWMNTEKPVKPDTYAVEDKSVTVFLESNPTTGFDWYYEVKGEGIKFESDKFIVGDTHLIGAPGTKEMKFVCDGEGEFEIIFSYKRSWENRDASKTVTLKGNADKNGKITVTEFSI